MLLYAKDYEEAILEMEEIIKTLKKKGRTVFKKETQVIDSLNITRYKIKAIKEPQKRLIFTIGVHGIEGYVGHSCLKVFFNEMYESIEDDVEVILYHPVNPFGMSNFRRTNEHNVDLNRNFTANNFTSENPSYNKMEQFFAPKPHKGVKSANVAFYGSLSKNLAKHGIKTFEEATLFGQKVNPKGIYFSNNETEVSTQYLLEEMNTVLTDIKDVVWIDLHTGYGPRYQMSVVNSQFEKSQTQDLVDHINYPRVLGLKEDDFYAIDGDMIEKIYETHKTNNYTSNLYATCFEFGTYGESTKNSISSLKALIFENDSYFETQKPKFMEYSNKLIKEQFMPDEDKWKEKAHRDFLDATTDILTHYNFK